LDEIPGIGKIAKKNLLQKFGSTREIAAATDENLAEILNKNN
jgi:Nuclease subunit of the excinuclease complex